MTRTLRRAFGGALALAFGLLAGCSTGIPKGPGPTLPVRFLAINDIYILDTLTDGTGGLARVATMRARIEEAGPVLFTLAGDVLSPSLLSKYYNGKQMVEGLNAAKLDYATFGNHEFELPRDTLVARIAESKFKWLSANCTEANGSAFPGVLAFDTVRVQQKKIGIFGLTLPGEYRKYVTCANTDSVARRMADTLTALGVDMIVALTHQNLQDDYLMLQRDPRVDLILGGHEHEAHDSAIGQRHVVKADANSRSAQSVLLFGKKGDWREGTRLLLMDRTVPFDTAVAAVTKRWADSLAKKLGGARVIGTAAAPIDARDHLSRNGESPIGDLVADAMRSGTGADVALINSGTLRLDDVIPTGPMTNWTLESLFLFPDETRVVTFPLTGARLRALLEHGVSDGRYGKGAFPQVSGIKFTADVTRPTGSRLIGDVTRADGTPVKPTDTVRVAFDVYPACTGGDGYQVPEAAEACRAWEQAPRAADLVVRHIEQRLGGTVRGDVDGRITIKKGS